MPTIGRWCQFYNRGPRTTNHAEGWHNRLNTLFQQQYHPKMEEFLLIMQQESNAVALEARQLLTGQRLPGLRRRCDREAEDRIGQRRQNILDRLENGQQVDASAYCAAQAHNIAHNIMEL